MSRPAGSLVIVSIAYLTLHSVVGYENAYDLLERRNQKFYQPRYIQSTLYDDRSGYFSQNRPIHSEYLNVNPYYSKFGNGYDNIGNGIPSGHFQPFGRLGNWRAQRRPFRERTYNFDFYPTGGRSQHDYVNSHLNGYYPTTMHRSPSETYGNEFLGNSDFTKIDRFIEDNEDKKQKKTNELYQRTQEGFNLDSLKKEKSGEHLHTDQKGENKSTLRSNKIAKKGRTTKGFAIHHHKDETGNSTTFFDETSDFGDQSDLRDIADGFGTRRTLEQITHKEDEKYLKENEEQTGNFGTGLLSGNQRFEKEFSGHEETGKKLHTGNDDLGLRKTYQYLNGDPFEYTNPHVDKYY